MIYRYCKKSLVLHKSYSTYKKEIDDFLTEYMFNGLNPSTYKHLCLRVCSTSLLKILWEKENSFSNSFFYTYGELCAIFIKFKIVIFTSVKKSPKFVVWEKVEFNHQKISQNTGQSRYKNTTYFSSFSS